MITDFLWMKYLSPALMTLPDFANSMLTLLWLVVLLDVVCIWDGLACEICRGRHNSDSDAEILLQDTASEMTFDK